MEGVYMARISKLHIEGYRKFVNFDINFNENVNVLVGENEAGKSTILDALFLVLNQQYRNADKSFIKDLINQKMVDNFLRNPSVENLPYIVLELHLCLDTKEKNAEYFFGENNCAKSEGFGIRFECNFDNELGSSLDKEINEGKIPYEYYNLRWVTFAGLPYQLIKRPLSFLSINTSNGDSNSSFNYYNRSLFTSIYDENTRMSAKNAFRDLLNDACAQIGLPYIGDDRRFGINAKKVILESILSVYEGEIPLENRGSGMESLIKTQIALDRKQSKLDVILIEEPENHLSPSSMQKMLHEIMNRQENSQLIIATHSNLIACRLSLNNVLWITGNQAMSLMSVTKTVSDFFVKAADNSFLQLLLSEKVLLVEGATEFLLLPKLYYQITSRSIEQDGISIISCNGISYMNYIEIAKVAGKRVAVLTDNDGNPDKIADANSFNKDNDALHIFLNPGINEWTWEVCFYNLNKTVLESMISVTEGAQYLFHGEDYGQVLGKMLNNKVDTAYRMTLSDQTFEIPQYIEDAIKWLNK